MRDIDFSRRVTKSLVTFRIIWGAMLFSLLLYLGVGLYMSGRFTAIEDADTFAILRAVLFGASFVSLAASKILRVKALANVRTAAREGGEQSAPSVLGAYATATIISLALSESVAIYGLVLCLLGGGTTDLILLTGLAAAAMVYYRPREGEVLALAGGREPGGEYRSAQRD